MRQKTNCCSKVEKSYSKFEGESWLQRKDSETNICVIHEKVIVVTGIDEVERGRNNSKGVGELKTCGGSGCRRTTMSGGMSK